MDKYTVWEANRKIFLYPENWIEPSLRDNKSEQFRAFESTIQQNNISFDAVSEAVRGYVFDVNTVANLDVQAYLWERRSQRCGRFHFFARTRTIPHQFFYRCMDLKKFGDRLTYWHPWTKLDLGTLPQSPDQDNTIPKAASGTYLIPTVVQGRLMLFVPEIMLKTKEVSSEKKPAESVQKMAEKTPDQLSTRVKYWEVKMAWTELRSGKWTPKVYSPDVLEVVEEKPVEMAKRPTVEVPTQLDVQAFMAEVLQKAAEAAKQPQAPARPGKQNPRLEHFRFSVRSREALNTVDASVNAGADGVDSFSSTRKASFTNGVEDFLIMIIDVESCSEQQSQGLAVTATLLGQFEMRN
ncbi:uncharacterised protein [Colletotrichum tofieldiae]|nr:uncharacterised protein [Colletotrichum tofieldiae]